MQHPKIKRERIFPQLKLFIVVTFWLLAFFAAAFGANDSKASVMLAIVFIIIPGTFIGGIPMRLSTCTWNALLWIVTGTGLIAATAIYNHTPLTIMVLVTGFFCSHVMARYNRLYTRRAVFTDRPNWVHGCSLVLLIISGIYMVVLGMIGTALGAVGGFFFLFGGLVVLLGAFWGTSNGRKSRRRGKA